MPGQNRNRDTKKYLDNGVANVDEKWKNLGVLSVFGHAIEENGVVVDFAQNLRLQTLQYRRKQERKEDWCNVMYFFNKLIFGIFCIL